MRNIVHKIKIKKKDMLISDLEKKLKLYQVGFWILTALDIMCFLKDFKIINF